MRYRIRVETTNRHVHTTAWDDADAADLEHVEEALLKDFAGLNHLSLVDDRGRRVYFNPAHIVAVTIEKDGGAR